MSERLALLRELTAYAERWRIGPTALGKAICRDPNMVGRLQDGREPTEAKRTKVRAWLTQHADGPPASVVSRRAPRRIPPPSPPPRPDPPLPIEGRRVDRDACGMCGVRGDIGCRHRPAGVAW